MVGGLAGYDLAECLDAIDPASCSYEEWAHVGMALHAEGYPASVWDDWSRRDPARYRAGECESKWKTFGRSPAEVAGGTIVMMARDAGWRPRGGGDDPGHALGWDDGSAACDPDPAWIEPAEVPEPEGEWHGWRELVRYLEALFEPGEIVGYVTDAWEKDGRWVPKSRGSYTQTAGELVERLAKYGDDLASSLGRPNPEAGAWVRFNPLDGEGVRNDNVTEFRYALVESDELDVERQRGIIEEMRLPVAALVHSGNKSLHAIVRVDARDYAEYRKRVDYLYEACRRYGLALDTQNKNPSRLSRMPGVMRAGKKQWLVATNVGHASWDEWREWVEAANDDLPDPLPLASVWDDLPELSPPLVEGVLRQGHKMLLAGPSKAGKSFALIELCIAIAEGRPWLGFGCARGRVLYVNLELDAASCLHRFRDVYEALGAEPANLASIDVWNLRGKSKPMDELAPSLIRRALKTRPIAIVIDPIYKVITGDENSADQMARFCNQFDRVCTEVGCAVVYCHHHSKGAQGGKRAMDRASGSGVFARDPDAQLDMIELELSDDVRRQREDAAVCDAVSAFLDGAGASGWREEVPQDDRVVADRLLSDAKAILEARGRGGDITALLGAVRAARRRSQQETAWRIEGTLREFPRFDPLNLWFDYPVHREDGSGVLADVRTDAGDWQGRGRDRRKKTPQERAKDRRAALEAAFAAVSADGRKASVKDLADFLERSEKTVCRHLKEHGSYWVEGSEAGLK